MRRRDEQGVAVVIGLGLIAMMTAVALVAGGVVALVAAHRRSQAAADLAALAAAVGLRQGEDACGVAERIAEDNGADLDSCAVEGEEVSVVVVVRVQLVGDREVRARARAGPSADVS